MRTNKIQNCIKRHILDKFHLLKIEELDLSQQAMNEFDELYKQYLLVGEGNLISYHSKYPIYQFLNYIVETKNVLVHGSNSSAINNFTPKDSALFNGRPVKAVFATSDGVWSYFLLSRTEEDI
ncbi:hypothetical protein [Alkalihalobacterium alkalinitrilicum]|uniref:hypothetical protein n=1 Tax=Alkalihalobacterium alkalinitrilicum TaxID=427920 RepID=UPI000994B94E|nr:hypothetical protein [Alkalihalobacterium alkalinitrilicum]